MSTEELAFAFVAATKKRAQARSHLSALRRKWQDEGGEYFSEEECRGELGYDEMMAALKAREDCNTEYRRAKGRLFRACAAPLPAAAPKSGETPAALAEGYDGSGIRPGPNHATVEFWYDTEAQAVAAHGVILDLINATREAKSGETPDQRPADGDGVGERNA